MNQYEAMFLFDPNFGSDNDACETEIKRLIDRASGQIVFCRKWDERRLAYRIKGRKRGVYYLAYFTAPAESITGMNRDASISESILRLLVLRADGITPEMMERFATGRGASMTAGDGRSSDDDDASDGESDRRERVPSGVGFGDD